MRSSIFVASWRKTLAVGVPAAVALLSASCSTRGATSDIPATVRSAHTRSVVASTPGLVVPTPIPEPCGGGVTVDDAQEMVVDGLGVALVRVQVVKSGTADPADVVTTLDIQVTQVLAGDQTAISATSITEDGNDVLPGDWILLLGRSSPSSEYFLADGVRGSFSVNHDAATAVEQCAGGVATGGGNITPDRIDQLSEVFAAAFNSPSQSSSGSEPPSTSAPGPTASTSNG